MVMGDHDGLGIHDTCPPSNSAAAIAAAAAAEGAGESILAVSSSFYNFSFLSPFFLLSSISSFKGQGCHCSLLLFLVSCALSCPFQLVAPLEVRRISRIQSFGEFGLVFF